MMKREMNIRDLPRPLQYAAVGVLLIFVVVKPLNWIVGLIFGTPLLEMLFGPGVNEAYRSITQFIHRATQVIEGKSQSGLARGTVSLAKAAPALSFRICCRLSAGSDACHRSGLAPRPCRCWAGIRTDPSH